MVSRRNVRPVARAIRYACAAISLAVLAWPMAARADLLSFCLGATPTDPALLALHNAQCPGYIASQFANAATSAQQSQLTTQLAQQQSQAAILASYANMVKAPTGQISSGTDITALGIAGLKKDAQLTFGVTKVIGEKINDQLAANKQVLVVTATDLAALLLSPVDATTVKSSLDEATKRVLQLRCSGASAAPVAAIPAVMLGILGAEALLSTIATGASMFQPSLVAAAKITGVTDPQNIMIAGLAAGVATDNRKYLRVHVPAVTASNPILISLGLLRTSISAANERLASCAANDPTLKASHAVMADAKELVSSLLKTDGTKPSLLDVAARRAALTQENIVYTLLLSRDVSGGGVAAVKPNWFRSVALIMGSASGISYRLSDFDGRVVQSGIEFDDWSDRCSINGWTQAFKSCSRESASTAQ